MSEKEVSLAAIKECPSRRIVARKPSPKVALPVVVRDCVAVAAFPALVSSWLGVCEQERHSPLTIGSRQERTGRLLWFLHKRGCATLGETELRAFFKYLNTAQETPPYRWANPRCVKPLAPARCNAFHSSLRTFFNWLVDERQLDTSPMARIKPMLDRASQIEPFSEEDCLRLAAATRETSNPWRDRAILDLLLDTGLRAAELCDLTVEDVLLDKGQVVVRHGKGGKRRVVPFSPDTRRSLHEYFHTDRGQVDSPGEPLFLTCRGRDAGEGLTTSGLGQLFDRLKKLAKIEGVRCSPHTCRHYFAVAFLRAGGNSFTLQTILGHESLVMTQNYVKIADADTVAQHRQFSPVARLKRLRKGKQ